MNDAHFPYVYEQGHWIKEAGQQGWSLRDVVKQALLFVLVAVFAFVFAWGFVWAWDKQHDIDLAKTRAHIEGLLYDQSDTPARPEGRKLPTWGADGPAYSPGHEYYRAQAERGR